MADLGTSGWGAPSTPQSATVVPNRTGMRETEATAGRSSVQVGLKVIDIYGKLLRYRRTRRNCWPNRMQAWTCCMTLWSDRRAWVSKYLERSAPPEQSIFGRKYVQVITYHGMPGDNPE